VNRRQLLQVSLALSAADGLRSTCRFARRAARVRRIGAGRLVLEVLSPTTRDFDSIRKLEEYKTIAGLEYILFVEPNETSIAIWSRADAVAWSEARVFGLETKVDLPKLGIALEMSAIYEGVEFPPAPRLFAVDEPR